MDSLVGFLLIVLFIKKFVTIEVLAAFVLYVLSSMNII